MDFLDNISEARMSVRSWMVRAWPPVAWQPPELFEDFPAFHHLGTEVRRDPGPDGLTIGDTVWGTMVGNKGVVGVAWEWVTLPCGVIAILDPNGLVSNARFLTDDGNEVDELRAITISNVIAYNTPWQKVVQSCLRNETIEPQHLAVQKTQSDTAIVPHGMAPDPKAPRHMLTSVPPLPPRPYGRLHAS